MDLAEQAENQGVTSTPADSNSKQLCPPDKCRLCEIFTPLFDYVAAKYSTMFKLLTLSAVCCWACSEQSRLHWQQLAAAAGDKANESTESETNSTFAGHKTKTIS